MGNDRMDAIMIPQGVSVTLYDDDGFGGSSIVMTGGFTDSRQGMACQNLPSLVNKVSSLVVTNTNRSYNTANGTWNIAFSG